MKKSKRKRRGFTLIEVLGAIVILGIISTIAIVSVNKVMKNSHEKYEISQNDMFTMAAQTYFTDHKKLLPVTPLTTNIVTLKTLIEQNYIDKIVDYKKREYDTEKSIATVKKMGINKYIYYSKLVRSDGESTDTDLNGKYSPTIKFSYNKNPIAQKYYTNNSIKVNISINDKDGLAAYKYFIYKGNKKYFASEFIIIDSYNTYNDAITLNKKDLTDGTYSIKVIAYDYKGDSGSATSTKIIIDTIKPTCKITLDNTANKNGWYNKDVNIKMTIKDNNKYKNKLNNNNTTSDLKINEQETITVKQTSNTTKDGINWYGYAQDKAGNMSDVCTINIKLDTEPPTCNVDMKSLESYNYMKPPNFVDGWTKENVRISRSCQDNIECDSTNSNDQSIDKTVTDGNILNEKVTFADGKVYDLAGNYTTCDSYSVKIDKQKPDCSKRNENTSWKTGDLTVYYGCNDNGGVGCATAEQPKYFNNQTSAKTGTIDAYNIADKLGNSTTCSSKNIDIYLDNKKPTISISNPTGGNWTNEKFKLTINISNLGASGGVLYGKYDNNAYEKITDLAPYATSYTTNYFSAQRNATRYYYIKTNAGISSDTASTKIKIDTTDPEITIVCNSDKKGVTATCTDSGGSGRKELIKVTKNSHPENDCGTEEFKICHHYTDCITEASKATEFKCTDNAGNSVTKSKSLTCKCTNNKISSCSPC